MFVLIRMSTYLKDIFLQLVRLGIGCVNENDNVNLNLDSPLSVEDWQALEELANEHGLLGVMLDGIEGLRLMGLGAYCPPKPVMLQLIGQVLQSEQQYAVQEHAATEMALLLHQHGIRTYVLKGAVVAECYPKPKHRLSADMDCFLVNDNDNQGSLRSKSFENLTENLSDSTLSADSKLYTLNSQQDIWERGNRVLEEQGFEVRRYFYKNSTVILPGLTVENHRYLTPFRGNKRLKSLERLLQRLINENDNLNENDNHNGEGKAVNVNVSVKVEEKFGLGLTLASPKGRFEGTWLYRPPVMVSALFLIEHAYSHFLHEGLTWRLILDWQMFCRRHRQELDWQELEARVDEFGFRRFYDTFNVIGQEAFGSRIGELENSSSNFSRTTDSKRSTIDNKLKSKMLEDIWASLDVHETVTGLRGKLALTGNIWRARWKYRLFSDITWLQALWIQAKGVLFENNPKI